MSIKRIDTVNGFIAVIEALSPFIQSLSLKDLNNTKLDKTRCSFANSQEHQRFIADAFENLSQTNHPQKINRTVLVQLAKPLFFGKSSQFEGAFGELFIYDLLARSDLGLKPQLKLSANEVIGINGVTLDGSFHVSDQTVYFDVKSFGMVEKIAKELKSKLRELLPSMDIHISGLWRVSVDQLETQILPYVNLISQTLAKTSVYQSHGLEIRMEPKQVVSVNMDYVQPYKLASDNATYFLSYAHKFTKDEPFVLFFVVHPWLGGFDLSNDFDKSSSEFVRALARRTFIQFLQDNRPINTLSVKANPAVTAAEASQLLSGICILNAWQVKDKNPTPSWFFSNPNALNPVDIRAIFSGVCHSGIYLNTMLDDFMNDNY